MFAGIVEAKTSIQSLNEQAGTLTIILEKPTSFNDIGIGDSIAVNGVCLTVESFNDKSIQFSLGPETLRVTGWSGLKLQGQVLNLERSLRWGDRVHGHVVLGHVDGMAEVVNLQDAPGPVRILEFRLLKHDLMAFLWQKGSVTVNGVSLTVNEVNDATDTFSVCLIPETLKRTNLADLQHNHLVTIEVDQWARAYQRHRQWEKNHELNP